MPPGPLRFPFSAVYGMESVKKALMCAMVNPRIKTVLIRGTSGAAKTTLARSVAGGISGKNIVNIPLNTTEDQIFGGIDIESALKTGEVKLQPGLMSRADGNIVYMDDVNLFDQRILSTIMECVLTGVVTVERGQVSDSYGCTSTLIATMNPQDTDISSHMLDRFDLCAYTDMDADREAREEILRRNIEFIDNPIEFNEKYSEAEAEIKTRIERAVKILPLVTISDELASIVSELCYSVGADGYRGDIAMINASLTLAALEGRDEVNRTDVEEAAGMCLPHRRNYSQEPPEPPPEEEEQDPPEEEPPEDEPPQDEPPEQEPPPEDNQEPPEDHENEDQDEDNEDKEDESPPDLPSLEDMLFNIGEQFKVIDYLNDRGRLPARTKSRKGRRGMTESGDMTGRYARSRLSNKTVRDVAFDATIRAAAPYQRNRHSDDLKIVIEKQDLREKVRERQSGCTLLFLVDASGSLGVRKRMVTVKGAILSMLKESYVKRDRIGMMAFRRTTSEMILPPTKSVEYSYKKLEELPTGGKTPLGEALVSVDEYMTSYSRCHPGERCFIILVTDGRANVPLKEGADANQEVQDMAEDLSMPGVKWIVVDTGYGYMRFDNAQKLAQKLNARYFRLEDLDADRLAAGVKSAIG